MTYSEDVKPGNWIKVIRCLKLDGVVAGVAAKTLKEVLFYLATYADYDYGNDVRPGTARIAVECEIDYRTAKRCLAAIRDLGLIRLVRSATRRGHADEYQLTIPADLHDRGILRTPDEVDNEIEQIRRRHRRDPASSPPAPDDDPGTGRSRTRIAPTVRGNQRPVQPVDDTAVRDTQRPVQEPVGVDRTGNPVPATSVRTVQSVSQYGSLYVPPPRHSTETTTTTETTDLALRTDLAVSRASPAEQDPPSNMQGHDTADDTADDAPPPAQPCPHGVDPAAAFRCPACTRHGTTDRDPTVCEHGLTIRTRQGFTFGCQTCHFPSAPLRLVQGGAA